MQARQLPGGHPLESATHLDRVIEAEHESGDQPASRFVPDRARRAVLSGLVFGTIAISLDLTIVNVALPTIRDDLGGSIETIQWVASLYSLSFAVFLVPAGRLVDMVGPRRIFILGALTYALASLAAGAAPNDLALILARIPQGMGAAMVGPSAVALLTRLYERGERGRVFGMIGALLGASSSLAPLLGGLLTDLVSWRAIFLVNIPLMAVAVALVRTVPADIDGDREEHGQLNLVGAALLGAVVVGIELALIESTGRGFWPFGATSLALATVSAVGLWIHDRHRDRPILDVPLLRDSVIAASVSARFISAFAFNGMFLYMVLYLQGTLGLSAVQTGLVILPSAAAGVLAAPLVGRHADGSAARTMMVLGLGLLSLSLFLLVLLDAESSIFFHLLPGLTVNGIGFALVSIPTRVIPLNRVPESEHGRLTSMISMAGKLAAGLGVAFAAMVFHQRSADRTADVLDTDAASGLDHADIVGSLAVNDLPSHLNNIFPDAATSTLAGYTQVIEDTYLLVLDDVLTTLALLLLAGMGLVWFLLRKSSGGDEADEP